MKRPGKNRATLTGAKGSLPQVAVCPLVCTAHHRDNPPNERGRVTSTYCALCGQRILRSEWLKEFLAVGS